MKAAKGITAAQRLAKARHEFELAADAYAHASSDAHARLAELGSAAIAFSKAKRESTRGD